MSIIINKQVVASADDIPIVDDNAKKRFDLFKEKYPDIKIEVLMKQELTDLGVL